MKKKLIWISVVVFSIMNVVAYVHAYKFTHFSNHVVERTNDPTELDALQKMKLVFTGIENPRPSAHEATRQKYTTIEIQSTELLSAWSIKQKSSNGTVILFHGYAGEKSSLLTRAEVFRQLGYNTVLVDFMGSGESGGNSTSIGYIEGEQVRDCYKAIMVSGEKNVFLFGTSMGAAAILKAVDEYGIKPSGIILECPFGSLYKTVCARFKLMNIPAVPMAALLAFWGGVQNGYWAFSHNPSRYASSVKCPTLLLFGEQDNRVSMQETQEIFNNLKCPKTLKIYPNEGHQVFTPENKEAWTNDVTGFLLHIKLQ
jgi:alpha-beta hydrolase superfamily lysophospholipase